MKEKGFKLWIIVLILMLVTASGLACSMINIELEPEVAANDGTPGYGDTVIKAESEDTFEIKKNFTHFVNVASDFIGTVFGGKESKYDGIADAIHDENDEQIISDTGTVAETEEAQKTEELPQLAGVITSCKVVRVVDGDTFVGDIGGKEEKIRLIGIDTPESVHEEESRNTVWGQYASDHTKAILIEGQTVYLEYDVESKDIYDRTLAYVWFSDDTSNISNMLNARLLSDGYAMDKVFEPNNKYAEEFRNLRQTAQQNGTGLWADEGFAALWEG